MGSAAAYEQLLTNLLVLEMLPAWSSNRLKRLVRTGKRMMIDTALVAGALGMDVNAVLRDADLLGRVLETFVLAQLRGELTAMAVPPRLHQLRQQDGRREVDLLVDYGASGVAGIEVGG